MESILEQTHDGFDWRDSLMRATTVRDIARIFERVFGGSFPVSPEQEAWENATTVRQQMDARATSRAFPVVASVKSGVIKKTETKSAIQVAQEWVRKNVPEILNTPKGEVLVTARGIKNSLSHGVTQEKLDAIQALAPTLENGVCLGSLPDKDGNRLDNYYFAAKFEIDREEKILFVRTRQAYGDSNRFYVHEIYTESEIKKAASTGKIADPDRSSQRAATFYINLIAEYLAVKTDEEQ